MQRVVIPAEGQNFMTLSLPALTLANTAINRNIERTTTARI